MNLPKYRCHKVVEATKILEATRRKDGSMELVTEAGEFRTKPSYFDHFIRSGTTKDLGYFVRYEDGYESWSPTKAFEEGYSPLQELEDNRTANALDEPSEPTEKPVQPKRRGRKKKSETAGQPSDN